MLGVFSYRLSLNLELIDLARLANAKAHPAWTPEP